MSCASIALTPRFGMAVPGSTACGSVIHRRRLSALLGSSPAMYDRAPKRVNGGPTSPPARSTPGTVWQEPHPYWAISFAPRSGRPARDSGGGGGEVDAQPVTATTGSAASTVASSQRRRLLAPSLRLRDP